MELIASIAIRRHGADDWDELESRHSKQELRLFRVVGGRPAPALRTIDTIASGNERKPIVVLTCEGLRRVTAKHYEICSRVSSHCRSLQVDVALCAVDASHPALARALPELGYTVPTYASIADFVAQLTEPGGASRRPPPKPLRPKPGRTPQR